MSRKVWRVYRGYPHAEFGKDYPTLEAAQRARAAYAYHWPTLRYYIRAVWITA